MNRRDFLRGIAAGIAGLLAPRGGEQRDQIIAENKHLLERAEMAEQANADLWVALLQAWGKHRAAERQSADLLAEVLHWKDVAQCHYDNYWREQHIAEHYQLEAVRAEQDAAALDAQVTYWKGQAEGYRIAVEYWQQAYQGEIAPIECAAVRYNAKWVMVEDGPDRHGWQQICFVWDPEPSDDESLTDEQLEYLDSRNCQFDVQIQRGQCSDA